MYRFSSFILIAQAFCIYHAYKNKKEYYWYLLIIFLPFLGSVAYLYIHFATRRNIDNVATKIKTTVNSNYEIQELLKESKYADTIANRIKLADAYASKNKYLQAIALYESSLEGFNKDDIKTREKLMVARYFVDDFEEVLKHGEYLVGDPLFKNSESRIVYAWSLSALDMKEKAEAEFKEMDVRFGNYIHRTEYVKYLLEQERPKEAKELLLSLQDEIAHMDRDEQRQKKDIAKEIEKLMRTLKNV